MSEFLRLRGNEGYGSCDDAPAVWFASAIALAVGLAAAKLLGRVWKG